MKTIPLTDTDKVTLVDDEDFKEVSKYRWRINPEGYVMSSKIVIGKERRLHRLIINVSRGMEVDHVDHDPLNNTRKNLRIVTRSQNMGNCIKHRDKGKGQYKGVYWHKRGKKWMARICHNYEMIYLGLFKSEEQAAIAYDLAALKYFKEFSKLNFPERITFE
jgi:hypothetical protein